MTPLSFNTVKGMETVLTDEQEDVWAEARVTIRTVGGKTRETPQDQTQDDTPSKSARVGVCVGISEYQHDRIRDLQVSHQDAQRMAQALKEKCGVDDMVVLLNAQATKEAIRRAIFVELPKRTRPGDTVFLFFSGHVLRPATLGDFVVERESGPPVYGFLRNFQNAGIPGIADPALAYGAGWNVIAAFDPDVGEIRVRSYRIDDVESYAGVLPRASDHTGRPADTACFDVDHGGVGERVLPWTFPRAGSPRPLR